MKKSDLKPKPKPIDRLISDKEVSAFFGISPTTVMKWVGRGLLPKPVRNLHKCTRWSEEQIQAAMKAMRTTAPETPGT